MTTMKEAMMKAGVNPIENALLQAVATYLGAGGTVKRLHELVAQATAGMSGEGHAFAAGTGQLGSAPARQPNREAEGHLACADKAKGHLPSTRDPHHAQAGHGDAADKAKDPVPAAREPSTAAKAAAKRVAKFAANTIWAKTIGGEITVGGSTRHHWQTLVRKGVIMTHVGQRMLTEIDWPDDTTPLEQVASEAAVKKILDSGYGALNSIAVRN